MNKINAECNSQSLTKYLSKFFAFFKNPDQHLPNLKLNFSVLTMKASTLRDNQSRHDVTVAIAAAIVLRNLTPPPNADEDSCVDSLSSQWVSPRCSTWKTWRFQQLITWANDRLRKTEKAKPDENSVASSNRRFLSPSGEVIDIRGTSADRRSFPLEKVANGQLWSGRRFHKLVCRHIALI